MHVVAREHLGVPQASTEAFELLAANGQISPELAAKLRAMVAFRNIAVHEHQRLDIAILRRIVESRGRDSIDLCSALGSRSVLETLFDETLVGNHQRGQPEEN